MMAVSSGVWAEAVPLETAWNLAEVTPGQDGKRKTMKQELERIGFLGSTPASYRNNPFAAHFELHIEQGPILEEEGRRVGVVKGLNQLTIILRNLVDVSRRASIQMVPRYGLWPRHARRHYSLLCPQRRSPLRRQIDRPCQHHRKTLLRPCDHRHCRSYAGLDKHHGPYSSLHTRHQTHRRRKACGNRRGVQGRFF